jgi:hypothetical protein
MAERKGKGGAARKEEVVTREYTINLHKRLHGWYFISPSPSCCPLAAIAFCSTCSDREVLPRADVIVARIWRS